MRNVLKKYKKVFILLGIIIVIIFLVLGIFSLVDKKMNKNNNSNALEDNFDDYLEDTIVKINDLNKVLTSENINENVSYTNESGFICKKYIGEDKAQIIKDLKTIYEEPFSEYGYFDLIEVEGKDDSQELYVCLPEGCIPKEIKKEETEVSLNEENSKIVNFSGTEVVVDKVEGNWKLTFPVTICSLDFLINEDSIENENN